MREWTYEVIDIAYQSASEQILRPLRLATTVSECSVSYRRLILIFQVMYIHHYSTKGRCKYEFLSCLWHRVYLLFINRRDLLVKFKLALYISVPILIVHFYLCDTLVTRSVLIIRLYNKRIRMLISVLYCTSIICQYLKWEWGCWRRQFLAIWVATSSETSEIRPAILYDDMLSLVGLWLIAK